MAIKPTDSIIHLEKLREIVGDGWNQNVIYPSYWTKFLKHVSDIHAARSRSGPNRTRRWVDYQQILRDEVKQFKGTYLQSSAMGEYVKFKKASDMTFFIMRWS